MHPIDWDSIAAAMSAYQRLGYRRIEVPWTAPLEVLVATIQLASPGIHDPARFVSVCSGVGHMVGSAEQSILASRLDGSLPPGKYVACTPCFRAHDGFTDIHQPYFVKVELWVDTGDHQEHRNVMKDARSFMATRLDWKRVDRDEITELRDGPMASDLMLSGIEIGSYGWREFDGISWAYGTGIAEPRFSIAARK